jgi:hypothetical protein
LAWYWHSLEFSSAFDLYALRIGEFVGLGWMDMAGELLVMGVFFFFSLFR